MKTVIAFLLLVLVGLNILAFVRISGLETRLTELQSGVGGHYELAEPMGAFQRFADKLFFAGTAENWTLAAFYLHEIEETAEEIIAHGVVEDDIEISPLMRSYLLPVLNQLRSAVENEDRAGFTRHYEAMAGSCNACHQATRHDFIEITVPAESMFKNQNFSPRTSATPSHESN